MLDLEIDEEIDLEIDEYNNFHAISKCMEKDLEQE